jgi:hypothetical protein
VETGRKQIFDIFSLCEILPRLKFKREENSNSFLIHAEILISRYQFRFSQFHGQKIFANLFIDEETLIIFSSHRFAKSRKSILRFSHSQFLSTGTLFHNMKFDNYHVFICSTSDSLKFMPLSKREANQVFVGKKFTAVVDFNLNAFLCSLHGIKRCE